MNYFTANINCVDNEDDLLNEDDLSNEIEEEVSNYDKIESNENIDSNENAVQSTEIVISRPLKCRDFNSYKRDEIFKLSCKECMAQPLILMNRLTGSDIPVGQKELKLELKAHNHAQSYLKSDGKTQYNTSELRDVMASHYKYAHNK